MDKNEETKIDSPCSSCIVVSMCKDICEMAYEYILNNSECGYDESIFKIITRKWYPNA